MVNSSTRFSDIKEHWARPFIEGLAQRGIVSGFPDGTFRPKEGMTRAQFAATILKAFEKSTKRQSIRFVDVPSNFWAAAAIQKAYETEFLSGYPDKTFRPDQSIPRVQVLVSLVNGLGISSDNTSEVIDALSKLYRDAAEIPEYATDEVAKATIAGMVINYPDRKLLKPMQGATRGEVAAFLYQALVYLGKIPSIDFDYIIVPPTPTPTPTPTPAPTPTPTPTPIPTPTPTVSKISHKREFRGVWVAAVNGDWPSKQGLRVDKQKSELIEILDRMQAQNFNALVLQVRAEGDALYDSTIEPWSLWLTGTQGQAPNPLYDPLQFAIAECHKRNIELHAWFNLYRAKVSTKTAAPVSPHIAVTHPESVYQYGNQLWMDPGAKVVQDRAYDVIMDVVRRYDVDGIHIYDSFYPYPIAEQPFPDNKTYEAYQATGGKLSLADWRRENIDRIIQRLSEGIRAAKSHVKFGISPFGIYRPGQPTGIIGLDAYNSLYADSKKWLEQGWVDYLAPQLYWRIDQAAQSYSTLLKWWTQNNPKRRHIYAGVNLGQLDGTNWTLEEITKQIEITRGLSEQLAVGNIFYSMKAFNENRQGISDRFKASTYVKPALVPAMSHLDSTAPVAPSGVTVKDSQISWNAASGDVRSWTLYKKNGDTWAIASLLPAATTSAKVEPGTYALCAVDRMANESTAVEISVK